jgi:LysR family transcriptional activator of nhaA
MEWLNYHHLRYFWSVAREGSLRAAAEKLGVSQPSISAQIHQLEDDLGATLFRKSGRSLTLTDTGRMVFNYAEEIFGLGRDLMGALRHGGTERIAPFHVGLTDTLPKLAAAKILRPVFGLAQPVRTVCHEDDLEDLLPMLASHRLDLILADEPAPSTAKFKTFSHSLGSSGVTLCAAPRVAEKLRRGFPQSLDRARALLPLEHAPLRRALEQWFDDKKVRPQVIAEFDDPALMHVFALEAEGFFPVHSIAVDDAVTRYGFRRIAELEDCRSGFFAITAERKLKHPALLAVSQNAQSHLFA